MGRHDLAALAVILCWSAFAVAALAGCGETSEADQQSRASATSTTQFALYALSRGKGVPEPTRGAYQNAQRLLEAAQQRGEVLALKETRIGLEGETRLCVEAKDVAAARELQREVRAMAQGVELLNVVEELCLKK